MLITLGLFVCFQNPHALYNSLKQTVINADVHPETFAMMENIDFTETLLIETNRIIFFSSLYALYELGRILSSSFDYHMYSNTRSIAFIPYKYTFLFSQKIYKNIIQCFLSSNKDVGMPVEVKQQYFLGFLQVLYLSLICPSFLETPLLFNQYLRSLRNTEYLVIVYELSY